MVMLGWQSDSMILEVFFQWKQLYDSHSCEDCGRTLPPIPPKMTVLYLTACAGTRRY